MSTSDRQGRTAAIRHPEEPLLALSTSGFKKTFPLVHMVTGVARQAVFHLGRGIMPFMTLNKFELPCLHAEIIGLLTNMDAREGDGEASAG